MAEHESFQGRPPGEPIKGKTYRADGWRYIDVPWMTPSNREDLLKSFGKGHYVELASTTRTHSGEKYWRGQMLISPQGVENALRAATSEKKNGSKE